NIRGDDHAAATYLIANGFRREPLAFRDVFHLLGDSPLAGAVHLSAAGIVFAARAGFLLHHVPMFSNTKWTKAYINCGLCALDWFSLRRLHGWHWDKLRRINRSSRTRLS